MNEFMKVLLSLSVSGTLLLLLILGLKPLYKTKFSKRWQYYIWIIVALRFLLPFTPDTTIVGSLFEKSDTTVITDEIPTNPNVPVLANTDNNETEPIQTGWDITAVAMREPFNIYACLFFIWSTLALVLFVRKITIYQSFIQYIKAGNAEVSDIKLLNLLSDCEEKLNKMPPLRKYHKAQPDDTRSYVGIALDEPKRLARLNKEKDISLLAKYGMTEADAWRLCEKYDMLSPCYQHSKRNGCWFCPNASTSELSHMVNRHPDLFEKLIEWEHTDNLYHRRLTRTETPSEIKARLSGKSQPEFWCCIIKVDTLFSRILIYNHMWLSLLVSHPKVLKMGQHIVQNKGMTPKREKMRHVKETEDAPE